MKLKALLVLAIGLLIAADAPKSAADKKDKKALSKLEGSWVMVSGEKKGESLPEKTVKSAKLTIVGNRHTVEVGGETILGTHKLNATKKPKEIDASDTVGPFEGKTVHGIYKLEKGQFTVCFAPPGTDRPKEFTTKSGTGLLLHVWKRQKK